MNEEKNNLEDFLRENRAALDEVEAIDVEKMWRVISDGSLHSKLPPEGTGWKLSIGRYWRWSIAAGIVLAIGVYLLRSEDQLPKDEFALADHYPELAQEEKRYQQLIAQKEADLNLEELRFDDFESIFEELAVLEEIQTEYRRDLPAFYDNEQLARTLIRYYEQKIRILERLAFELKKQKEHEKRIREKSI